MVQFVATVLKGALSWCVGAFVASWILLIGFAVIGFLAGGWQQLAKSPTEAVVLFVPFVGSYVLGVLFVFSWAITCGALKYFYYGIFLSFLVSNFYRIRASQTVVTVVFSIYVIFEVVMLYRVEVRGPFLPLGERVDHSAFVIIPAIVGSFFTLLTLLRIDMGQNISRRNELS